jgi:hypothetical protein
VIPFGGFVTKPFAAVPPGANPVESDRKILALLLAGLTDQAVANQLDLSLRTLQRRLRHLMDAAGHPEPDATRLVRRPPRLGVTGGFQPARAQTRRGRGDDTGAARQHQAEDECSPSHDAFSFLACRLTSVTCPGLLRRADRRRFQRDKGRLGIRRDRHGPARLHRDALTSRLRSLNGRA